jgi:hypothetical protein
MDRQARRCGKIATEGLSEGEQVWVREMIEKHRLLGSHISFTTTFPTGLKSFDLLQWLIGRFVLQFSALETSITNWLTVAIDPLHPVYGHVCLRDVNFMHKVKLAKFMVRKKMTFESDWKSTETKLNNINDLRNQIAHGAIEYDEDVEPLKFKISMPSRDGLFSDKRKIYNMDEFNDIINEIFLLITIFDASSYYHKTNIVSKRYLKKATEG